MNLAIIIHSNDPETVWNAFRYGIYAIKEGDIVTAFLMARGVEAEGLDTDQFKVTEMMRTFADEGGEILACGTCLKNRDSKGSELCPMSTMVDLYELIKNSDKIVTF